MALSEIEERHYREILGYLDQAAKRHPGYGGCDALDSGSCSECMAAARQQGLVLGVMSQRGAPAFACGAGGLVSSTNRGANRKALDAYYTPDALAAACVERLGIADGNSVLEPHVGGGAFARAARAAGADVIGVDINPDAPGFGHCYHQYCGDFLTADLARRDWAIGNPPFNGFEAHVERALEVASHVGFILRLNALGSVKRRAFWQGEVTRRLHAIHIIRPRPSFTGSGSDSCEYALFVWGSAVLPVEFGWLDWERP